MMETLLGMLVLAVLAYWALRLAVLFVKVGVTIVMIIVVLAFLAMLAGS
jgi:hypothetical protein